MADELAGFPWWEVAFDQAGNRTDPVALDGLVTELDLTGTTDLLVMCYGWKNDHTTGRAAYANFFAQVRAVLNDHPPRPGVSIGAMGIYWPATLWPDDRAAGAAGAAAAGAPGGGGGPAALAAAAPPAAVVPAGELVAELKQVYPGARQQAALDELGSLLERQPDDPAALKRFQALLRELVPVTAGGEDGGGLGEPADAGLRLLVDGDPEEVFDILSADSDLAAPQGVAGLGAPFRALWAGAKEAMRQATYWEMKNRAGTVGQRGIGPLIGALHHALPELRVHLCGHSFGARAVSFALPGIPAPGNGDAAASPVKSLMLVQGAFSHYAFATALPFDRTRGGALAGMAARVDGPLLVTHSLADLAVGRLYPLASLVAHQDAAALDDLAERWWAMGHRGAHGVPAADATLGAAGTAYRFAPGSFVNLDANGVIRVGGPPSGAHSDIFHPQVAWALLAGSATVPAESEGDLVGA